MGSTIFMPPPEPPSTLDQLANSIGKRSRQPADSASIPGPKRQHAAEPNLADLLRQSRPQQLPVPLPHSSRSHESHPLQALLNASASRPMTRPQPAEAAHPQVLHPAEQASALSEATVARFPGYSGSWAKPVPITSSDNVASTVFRVYSNAFNDGNPSVQPRFPAEENGSLSVPQPAPTPPSMSGPATQLSPARLPSSSAVVVAVRESTSQLPESAPAAAQLQPPKRVSVPDDEKDILRKAENLSGSAHQSSRQRPYQASAPQQQPHSLQHLHTSSGAAAEHKSQRPTAQVPPAKPASQPQPQPAAWASAGLPPALQQTSSVPEWGSRLSSKSPLPPALQQFGSVPEWGLRQQSLQAGLQTQLQQLQSQQHSTASNTAYLMQLQMQQSLQQRMQQAGMQSGSSAPPFQRGQQGRLTPANLMASNSSLANSLSSLGHQQMLELLAMQWEQQRQQSRALAQGDPRHSLVFNAPAGPAAGDPNPFMQEPSLQEHAPAPQRPQASRPTVLNALGLSGSIHRQPAHGLADHRSGGLSGAPQPSVPALQVRAHPASHSSGGPAVRHAAAQHAGAAGQQPPPAVRPARQGTGGAGEEMEAADALMCLNALRSTNSAPPVQQPSGLQSGLARLAGMTAPAAARAIPGPQPGLHAFHSAPKPGVRPHPILGIMVPHGKRTQPTTSPSARRTGSGRAATASPARKPAAYAAAEGTLPAAGPALAPGAVKAAAAQPQAPASSDRPSKPLAAQLTAPGVEQGVPASQALMAGQPRSKSTSPTSRPPLPAPGMEVGQEQQEAATPAAEDSDDSLDDWAPAPAGSARPAAS